MLRRVLDRAGFVIAVEAMAPGSLEWPPSGTAPALPARVES